jgi:ABC-type nickel/cobalt efflux system permease component RcnA
VFWVLGLVPTQRNAFVVEAQISLNYTTVLNIIFLILAAILVWRFLRTGGPEMLKMMGEPGHEGHGHHHHHHHEYGGAGEHHSEQ